MWRSRIIMVAIAACAAFGSRWAMAQDLEGLEGNSSMSSSSASSTEDAKIGEESHAADMHEAVDEAMKSEPNGTPEPLNHAENMEARNEAHATKATHSGGNSKHKKSKAKKKSSKAKRGTASVAKKKKSSKKAKRGTASVSKKKKAGGKSKKKSGKKSKKKKRY